MESERVEMSVGGDSANGRHIANGVAVNGVGASSKRTAQEPQDVTHDASLTVNGTGKKDDRKDDNQLLQDAPQEVLAMLSTEFYLPMARLVSRSAQECWNDLVGMVEKLARMPVSAQTTALGTPQMNDQSKLNLDKKDDLLNFANKYKAVFVKLLVLLAWSKQGEDVRKTIELNFWLQQRRLAFNNATFMIGQMMQDLANAQMPNPDLYTAAEVLAYGKVSSLTDLGYVQPPPLSPLQIVGVLRKLNYVLGVRLALDTDIPLQMRQYRVHDGRVTFCVPNEFELDLFLLNDEPGARFLMIDLRFLFSPAPSIPDVLHQQIASVTNIAIEKDGLLGAFNFIHDLTLSYKLSVLHTQAQELARGSWASHLKVDMLRRTLVVQYWLKRRHSKSWLEIGIDSGRQSATETQTSVLIPQLCLRWHKDGKLTDVTSVQLDLSQLSLEALLRQIIAQHISSIFDSIYDQLSAAPMYANADLALEQTTSTTDPSQCSLMIQLSQVDDLSSRIEPVSGAVVLGPVSEMSNRAQEELTRSRSLVDDFAPKISALRCAIAEAGLMRIMSSSTWLHLPGLRFTHTELEDIFSQDIARASFFRQPAWSSSWSLAVTQSSKGDYWWLMTHVDGAGKKDSRLTQILRSRPLHLEGRLSPAYLERLADYTTGVIMLQTNAKQLSVNKISYAFPAVPRFGPDYQLPAVRFERFPKSSLAADTGACIEHEVDLSYHGTDRDNQSGIMIARAKFRKQTANLRELASSHLDHSVCIFNQPDQVMIRVGAKIGASVIDEVMSKLRHVDNIVACAATVKRSSSHTLKSLSLSSITISYHTDDSQDLSLVLYFATASQDLHIDFLPAEENPHQHLAIFVTRMLTRRGQILSRNLEDVLALLKMTQPLMKCLDSIQSNAWDKPRPQGLVSAGDRQQQSPLRVHILSRQAASYAIHYFSQSEHFPRDVDGTKTPKKLLVRLEVFPTTHDHETIWVVRPAIEEFNSYTRPSFTSQALQERVKKDIFAKENGDWLRLDGGAAVSSEHPEKLLRKLHECIQDWLHEALAVDSSGEGASADITTTSTRKDSTSDNKTPRPSQPQRLSSASKSLGRANGISTPQQAQRHNQSYFGHTRNPSVKQEIITLD